jgi:UDP-N-acetylmuramoylalanine--D-glutamate ligase
VVVAGAARSGVAAARLLARRGASVTLSDLRDVLPEAGELQAGGIALELGGHVESTFARADPSSSAPASRRSTRRSRRRAGPASR